MGGIICITGSPATGKSSLGKFLASKLGCNHADTLLLARLAGSIKGYDEEYKEYIVDVEKLREYVIRGMPRRFCVVSGVLIPYYMPKQAVRLVVVLRVSPKVLLQRYKNRNYDKQKMAENLLSEAIGVPLDLAIKAYGENIIHEIDATHRTVHSLVAEILGILEETRKPVLRRIDWLEECMEDPELRELCFSGRDPF